MQAALEAHDLVRLEDLGDVAVDREPLRPLKFIHPRLEFHFPLHSATPRRTVARWRPSRPCRRRHAGREPDCRSRFAASIMPRSGSRSAIQTLRRGIKTLTRCTGNRTVGSNPTLSANRLISY